jgi:hypothetical protein
VPNASRGAYGDSSGSSLANRTFHGHTSWQIWPYSRFRIPLATGGRTLAARDFASARRLGTELAHGADRPRGRLSSHAYARRLPDPWFPRGSEKLPGMSSPPRSAILAAGASPRTRGRAGYTPAGIAPICCMSPSAS